MRPLKPPVDQRRPLRVAWESADWPTVTAELLARTTQRINGCRDWNGRADKDGYPSVNIGRKRWSAYRVMAIALNAGDVIPGMHVHHVCANRLCIAPAHLQVVTAAANTAEMLMRTWYVARIAELEAALDAIDPVHPLLTQLPYAM